MSDATPAEAAPEAGAAEATTDPYAQVTDRVSQLVDERLGSFKDDILSALPQQQEPQAEPDADPWAAWLDPAEDAEPEPAQPQLDMAQVRNAVRQDIMRELGPIMGEVQSLRAITDFQGLVEQHPDLKDAEVRQKTGEATRQLAEKILGPEHAHVLFNNPEFIANVHESLAGRERAAAEVAATGDPSQLEGAGGAAPGGVEQPNVIQQVMAARRSLPKGFR